MTPAVIPNVGAGQMQPRAATGPGGNIPAIPGLSVLGTPVNPAANPYTAPTGIVPGVQPTVATQNYGTNWADGSNTIRGDLKDTMGAGSGNAIADVLKGMGTVNDSAIQAMIQEMMFGANKSFGNIQASQAQSGIGADSSTAALSAGDFWSSVTNSMGSTIGNMELHEQDNLLQSLLGIGQAHGPDVSGFQKFMDFTQGLIPIASTVAGGLNETGMSGTGGFSEMLTMIAGL